MQARINLWSRTLSVIFVISFLLVGVSCSNQSQKSKYVVSGIDIEVKSTDPKASKIVHEECRRLDAIVNNHNVQSEISQLNKTFNKSVHVSKELLEILELARQVYELTAGAFDVSHGALYDYWKEKASSENKAPVSAQDIAEIKEKGGMDNIFIDVNAQTVTIKREGLKIDLSAMSRGYMIDKAVQKLKAQGISNAFISAGDDAYYLGTKGAAKPWPVVIQSPVEIEGAVSGEVLIDEAFCSVQQRRLLTAADGTPYNSSIDTRTGYPALNDIASVSVVSRNASTAASMAAVFSVMGLDGTRAFLSQAPSTMRVFIVTQNNNKKIVHVLR
jgi:FAD:protein FMN transferase